jgi:hypothetical protein
VAKRKKVTDGYTDEQKKLVLERYPYCKTNKEKQDLMQQLGMKNLSQLYNLANRLGATRRRGQDPTEHGVDEAFLPERRLEREYPHESNWTIDEDEYIVSSFGRMRIEEIAYHLKHTETAILYRARKVGARNYCKYWPASHVVDWLRQPRDVLIGMGMDIYPCYDRRGKLAIELVSTSSLIRIVADETLSSLLSGGGADPYFLLELEELIQDHADENVKWEASRWVSHGHTCLNPWSGESFELFDDGSDYKMYGRELYPSDLIRPYPGGGRWELS